MADPNSSTSFIPKNANRVRKPRTSKRIYIFSYISYVFFFGTLLAVLGVYVYSVQVENALDEQKELLAAEQAAFNEGDIAYVRNLEKRFLIAEELLEESSAPSRIFTAIESVIVDTVRITEFTYERLANNNFVLTFSGATDTFDSAMFQRDLLTAVPAFAAAEITEYSYGEVITEDGETSNETSQQLAAGEQLVVTFENEASTGLFPYEPPAEEEDAFATTTESSATSTDAATSTDSEAGNE